MRPGQLRAHQPEKPRCSAPGSTFGHRRTGCLPMQRPQCACQRGTGPSDPAGPARPEPHTASAHLPQPLQPTDQYLCGTFGVPASFVSRRLDILGSHPAHHQCLRGLRPTAARGAERGPVDLPLAGSMPPIRRTGRMAASTVTSVLRMSVGRSPADVQLPTLIGALAPKHKEFRRLLARHEVSCWPRDRALETNTPSLMLELTQASGKSAVRLRGCSAARRWGGVAWACWRR
jgi:hypothetical protein